MLADGFRFDFAHAEFSRDGTPIALSRSEQRLRQKLGKAYIQTVYGVGYRWGSADDK